MPQKPHQPDEEPQRAEQAQEMASADQPVEDAVCEGAASVIEAPSESEALQAQLAEAEAKVAVEHDQFLRTLAEFQNFRRRSEEQKKEDRDFANRESMLQLLPIIDNFERALAAAETSQSYEALMGGVTLTQRQLMDYLKKNGVEPITAVGEEFDPNFHEAVMRIEDGEHPDNTVVEELQRGYMMHTRVLRPSMVKVARKP